MTVNTFARSIKFAHTQTWLSSTRKVRLFPFPPAGYALPDRRGVHIKASHERVFRMFWESVAVGYTRLSACQSGRDKLLCTCSDGGLVVLICVKITKANKETNPPGRKALLPDSCGGVQSLLQAPLLVGGRQQQPAVVDCSECLYCLNKGSCSEASEQLNAYPHTHGSGRRK